MAKKVVRYLLEGDGSIPLFVENGGYFPVGEELCGLSVDEDARHVPATVVRLTKAELVTRAQNCHKVEGVYINDRDGNPYTDERIDDMVDAWLTMVGVPEYA